MNLCEDGHDEVCFEGNHCPACTIREEKDREIADLETKIDNFKSELDDLVNSTT